MYTEHDEKVNNLLTGWTARKEPARKCHCDPYANKCPAIRSIRAFVDYRKRLDAQNMRQRSRKKHGVSLERLLSAFGVTCQYCGEVGTLDGCGIRNGDNTVLPWTIDRVNSKLEYEPCNVTLSCFRCNASKCNRELRKPVLRLTEMEALNAQR